jgi:hypothetical protein
MKSRGSVHGGYRVFAANIARKLFSNRSTYTDARDKVESIRLDTLSFR